MSGCVTTCGMESAARAMNHERAASETEYAPLLDAVITGSVVPFSRLVGTVPVAGTVNALRSTVLLAEVELRLMTTSTVSAASLRTNA